MTKETPFALQVNMNADWRAELKGKKGRIWGSEIATVATNLLEKIQDGKDEDVQTVFWNVIVMKWIVFPLKCVY